jgi:hypothetical protein
VRQSLLAIETVLLLHDKELLDEVLAFVGDLCELSVVEVVVGLLDLAENFGSI